MADENRAVKARLRDAPFLKDRPAHPLRTIAGRLKRRRFSPGDVVFREGDPADTLFLIESGRVHDWTSDVCSHGSARGSILPRVYASSALDFRRIDQFVAAGEAAARVQLPTFEKLLIASSKRAASVSRTRAGRPRRR